MLNESISAYLQAMRRREDARKRFTEIAEIVNQGVQQIAEAQKNITANPRVHRYNVGFGRNGVVNPQNWPTAETINEARDELFAATTQVEELWNSIPQEQRVGLCPPHAVGDSGNGQ